MNIRTFGSTAAFALTLCGVAPALSGQEALPEVPPELATVRESLSRFKDFAQSETEFYAALGCIWYGDIDGGTPMKFEGGAGEMTGISYPKLMDNKVDPLHPEALIYEAAPDGNFKIAAAVYMVPATAETKRPSLFGREFDGPIHAEKATPLQHVNFTVYELHVWLWKNNPDGVFTRMNPDLPCRFDSYEVRAQPVTFPPAVR